MLPIYPEELRLARRDGSDALFEMFRVAGVTDVLQAKRVNVCRQRPRGRTMS
jgi:hypothetical protein